MTHTSLTVREELRENGDACRIDRDRKIEIAQKQLADCEMDKVNQCVADVLGESFYNYLYADVESRLHALAISSCTYHKPRH